MLKQVEQASPLDNKPKSKGHYNLKCQPNDQIKPKSCRIVIMNMNQEMQGHRVTIQHVSSDYECSGRRNALCKQKDSAQKELTFIRVLRKHFWWKENTRWKKVLCVINFRHHFLIFSCHLLLTLNFGNRQTFFSWSRWQKVLNEGQFRVLKVSQKV